MASVICVMVTSLYQDYYELVGGAIPRPATDLRRVTEEGALFSRPEFQLSQLMRQRLRKSKQLGVVPNLTPECVPPQPRKPSSYLV